MQRLLYFFLCFPALLQAQVTGTVTDAKGQPIPYVNIWVENENIGTTSQENGSFSIDAKNRTVVFSAVGFETKKTKIIQDQKVVLTAIVYELDEVFIGKLSQTRELEIGGMKKIRHTQLSGDKPWIYAKLFDYKTQYRQTPFIKSIVFYSDSEVKDAKLKIRVFGLGDSIPGRDLISEDIIVAVKKGLRKNTVDLSQYKLKMPENGVVIGLEWLIIPENFYEFKYVEGKSGKKVALPNYAPKLVVNYFDQRISFRYTEGKWVWEKKFGPNNKEPWGNNIMTPAINLILSN